MAETQKAPKDCTQCARWKEIKSQIAVAEVLAKAVEEFKKKLKGEGFQPTVAEFLKLVQMEHEYEAELNPPQEIEVRWIEPTAESNDSK